jgi:hypothetical protein
MLIRAKKGASCIVIKSARRDQFSRWHMSASRFVVAKKRANELGGRYRRESGAGRIDEKSQLAMASWLVFQVHLERLLEVY